MTKPIADKQVSLVQTEADAFNDATLQLNRAMGIADLIYSLSLVDGGIESLSNGTLTSATDAMFHLMSDAYEKLLSPTSNGEAS